MYTVSGIVKSASESELGHTALSSWNYAALVFSIRFFLLHLTFV